MSYIQRLYEFKIRIPLTIGVDFIFTTEITEGTKGTLIFTAKGAKTAME